MVIQRNTPFKLWGSALNETSVSVAFDNQLYEASMKEGKLEVILPAFKAGGPYEMTVIGSHTILIKDIYFSDLVKTSDDKLLKINANKLSKTSVLLQYNKPFKEVRYLWANNPGQVLIYDLDGFPASPFKSRE